MTGLIVAGVIFIVSAVLLLALVCWQAWRIVSRMLRRRADARAKEVAAARPKADVIHEAKRSAGRTRVISAGSLADAEAAAPPAPAAPAAEPEPETPALHPAIAAQAGQAIVFRRWFPPAAAPATLSFFGGVPVADAPFEWPRDPARGTALHFILQVDLAEVPAPARLGVLPGEGVLYVFLDLQWRAGNAFRTIWQPPSGGPWQEIDPPHDLGLAYGAEAGRAWPWALDADHGIPLLPRWPFAPVRVQLPPPPPDLGWDDEEGDAVPRAATWSENAEVALALAAAQGEVPDVLPLTVTDFEQAGGGLPQPWPGFPQNWLSVQICAAALVREAERAARFGHQWVFPDLDEAARKERIATVAAEAQAWFDHALGNPALAPLRDPEREAFWQWFSGHWEISLIAAPRAVEAAVETTLHAAPESAAEVPGPVLEALAARHALAARSGGRLHANIPDRMLAPYADVQGDQQERAATHLLLLELSSDEAIGHRFGEGVYQFWITPDDLAARRFEKVRLTTTAY